MDALTVAEHERLETLERTVTLGLSAFLDVGMALAEIRDTKLYRHQWGSFDAYVQDRWGIRSRRGYQLIEAAESVQNFAHPPVTESHARALIPFPEDSREPVYELAQKITDGSVTADTIKALMEVDLTTVLAMASAEPEFLMMTAQLLRDAGNGTPTASVVRSLAAVYHGIEASGAIDGPDGESISWADSSPEQRRAFMMANVDYETFERQQQHIARRKGSEAAQLDSPEVDRVYVPKDKYSHLRVLAALAPSEAVQEFRERWGDEL